MPEQGENITQEVVKPVTTRKRKATSTVKKQEQLVMANRAHIRLRSVKKSYIQNKRFDVKFDLAKVVYTLKSGKEIVTTFAQQLPEQGAHDLQTYLRENEPECFSLDYNTTLFTQAELDIVLLYDTEGKVIFVQEYGGLSF